MKLFTSFHCAIHPTPTGHRKLFQASDFVIEYRTLASVFVSLSLYCCPFYFLSPLSACCPSVVTSFRPRFPFRLYLFLFLSLSLFSFLCFLPFLLVFFLCSSSLRCIVVAVVVYLKFQLLSLICCQLFTHFGL